MTRNEKGQFEGESGNPSGRPSGSANVINREGREMMHDFFQGEFKKLSESIDDSDMSDYQKWMILMKIAAFIYPTQKAVMMDIDIDTMSDSAKGDIIATFIELWSDGEIRDNTKDTTKGDNSPGNSR